MKNNPITDKEKQFLIDNYPIKGKEWCCIELNRTEASVRYYASKLRLKLDTSSDFYRDFQERAANSKVGKKRPDHSIKMMEYSKIGKFPILTSKRTDEDRILTSLRFKDWHKNNNHPKGFKGKKHSKDSKDKMSDASKKMWANKNHKVNSDKHRQMLSDRASKQQQKGMLKNRYSNSKKGTYNINGKDIFFRSMWEANYALYLDFLIQQKQIKKWEFEPETFWFEKIKRGVRSYKPDFKVWIIDDIIEYHEVKGWMDSKSKTKLNRMRIYYPEIKMVLVDSKVYKQLQSKLGKVLSFYI